MIVMTSLTRLSGTAGYSPHQFENSPAFLAQIQELVEAYRIAQIRRRAPSQTPRAKRR